MEKQLIQSEPGAYDIYQNEATQRYVVLEGLDPDNQVVHYPIGQL